MPKRTRTPPVVIGDPVTFIAMSVREAEVHFMRSERSTDPKKILEHLGETLYYLGHAMPAMRPNVPSELQARLDDLRVKARRRLRAMGE